MIFEQRLTNYINNLVAGHNDSEGIGFMKNEYIEDVIDFIVKYDISLEELIELTNSKEYLVSYYAEVAYQEIKKNKDLSAIQIEINKLKDIESAIKLAESQHKKSVKEWISDNRYSEVGEMSVQSLLFITATKMLGLLKA